MIDNSLLKMYLILNVFLFILSVYIFFRVTPDLGKKSEYVFFRVFVVALQVYLVMNSLWTMQEYDMIQLPYALFVIITMLSYISVGFNAFCFYGYTMIRFDYEFGKKLWASLLGLSPLFLSIILLFISLGNGMIFSVTPDNHVVTGPAYLVLPGCSFIYLIAIVSVAVKRSFKTRTSYARKEAISYIGVVTFFMVWGILDGYFDRITIIPIAIFSVILFLFVSLLQANVYTDALTQMNNRRKTEEYLTDQIENLSETSPLYIFIIDINSFKQINDNYGHAEGDAVLVLFSSAVKEVISTYSGFASRYGGDEFVLAWRPQKQDEMGPKEFMDEIHKKFTEMCKDANKPYEISFSCGYVRCVDSQKTFATYLKEADQMMYKNKREFHAATK